MLPLPRLDGYRAYRVFRVQGFGVPLKGNSRGSIGFTFLGFPKFGVMFQGSLFAGSL